MSRRTYIECCRTSVATGISILWTLVFGIDITWTIETCFVAAYGSVFELNILARVALFLVVLTGELLSDFIKNVITSIISTIFDAIFEQRVETLTVVNTVVIDNTMLNSHSL